MRFLIEDYLDKEQKFYDYKTSEIENDEYFDISKSEMSKYTDYLTNPEETNKYYHTISSIKLLSPREYFEECAKIFDSTFEEQYHQIKRESSVIKHLKDVIFKYRKKFPITVLNYPEKTQEGRHRMFTLGELFGWDKKYPVLVIEETEDDKEYKKQQAILKGLNRLTNKALDYTYRNYDDFIEELKYYLQDLNDYVDYNDLDIVKTKKPSVIIQVDNVSYEIEDYLINIDPNKQDDFNDDFNIDNFLANLTSSEKEMFKFNN